MPLRIIQDQQGRTWQVWGVQSVDIDSQRVNQPRAAERPQQVVTSAQPGRAMKVHPQWADGWLAFETPGEKRRLAPVPTNWAGLSDNELADLCMKADPVRPLDAKWTARS